MRRRPFVIAAARPPSPGTPGEGGGEGAFGGPTAVDIRNHPHPNPLPAYRERGQCRAGGFTLIEVLAAMLLIGIVIPVVMQGISAATRAGSVARHRTEAATLAGSKLSELVATGTWDAGPMNGDFGADWPGYKWQASVNPQWAGDSQGIGTEQLDVQVTWVDRGQPTSVTVSTLVYVRPVPTS